MHKGFKIVMTIWLIVISIISILSLIRSFYYDVSLGIDYSGILVGILAALCTVLIGWQIYTIIDFNKRRKDLEEHEKKLMSIIEMQVDEFSRKIKDERDTARLETAFLGHLLLLIIGKRREKIVLEAFDRINQIEKSTALIRQMSYQALKGSLPLLLSSHKDFYLTLNKYAPQHFDHIGTIALEEYSVTQDESDYRILELMKELKGRVYP